MQLIRRPKRLMAAVFAASVLFGPSLLYAKDYRILLKDAFGVQILGDGIFQWDAENPTNTAEFTATLTVQTFTFTFEFTGPNAANIDYETDHATCVNPNAAPQSKVCPSRVRAVTTNGPVSSNPVAGQPTVSITLSDNATRNDRVGVWQIGTTLGVTFVTGANATVPAPPAALLLLAGLPALILVRRRQRSAQIPG